MTICVRASGGPGQCHISLWHSTRGASDVGALGIDLDGGLVTILTPGSGMVQLSSATLDRGHTGASDTRDLVTICVRASGGPGHCHISLWHSTRGASDVGVLGIELEG